MKASDFGDDFFWGVATAAAQIEGASASHHPEMACDFYHRYKQDIALLKSLGFSVFRFSISWSRILPSGQGAVNQEGIRFYHQVIDE
eukprot:gene14801-17937_t